MYASDSDSNKALSSDKSATDNDLCIPIDSSKDFDEDGIQLGIRSYTYHRDKSNERPDGKSSQRGTCSGRPLHIEETCKVSLRFGIREGHDGYIYLKQGCGYAFHTNHPKPIPGELSLKSRHLSESAVAVIKSGGNASIGSGSVRYFVLEHKQELISRGSMQRLQMVPSFLQNSSNPVNEHSTASMMINWMRKNASDPNVRLRYCFLSCRKEGRAFHRHSKGRPPTNGHLSITDVEDRMTYVDVLESTHKTSNDFQEETTDIGLESNEALTDASNASREINQDLQIDVSSKRVLLGAAWIDMEAYRLFLRFPEILFVDSTHKTNNEGRPLLLMCGRDQNGKAFVVCRIFMPNETSAFYRWVFLKCLPSMIGRDHLQRVRLVVTDGDAQEFDAVEEACCSVLPLVRRSRCMYHIVQKTFERSINNHYCLDASSHIVLKEIKRWIYSWSDGSSCVTETQYELSKGLLLKRIQSGVLEPFFTPTGLTEIERWIIEKILPQESSTAFWRKTYHRCFDEYMNNSGEAMNRSCKNSDISAKPNMCMATAANAMLNHSSLAAKD